MAVSITFRFKRGNNGTPRSSSSACTWRLTALCVNANSAAAPVARNDRTGVIAQEGRPTLIATRQTRWARGHVLSDSPWRNPQPKFQEQFIGNALFAPEQILGC
jgi:hypothetical protein